MSSSPSETPPTTTTTTTTTTTAAEASDSSAVTGDGAGTGTVGTADGSVHKDYSVQTSKLETSDDSSSSDEESGGGVGGGSGKNSNNIFRCGGGGGNGDDGSNGGPSKHHHHEHHPKRDPFFAFVPQTARFLGRLVSNEVGIAARAAAGFPAWSRAFAADTWTYYRTNPRVLYREIVSGFTVAVMQVPESIAFSFVAGVPPQSGLHATFWMATVTGILGGKPGMISGAAGALAVVVADLTADNGVLAHLPEAERLNVLYMTMFCCGIAQMLFAWLRLAKLVRLIPETGMIGFMNGLAIIIFMAQLPAFQKCDAAELFVDCSLDERQWLTFTDDTAQLCLTLLQVAICMCIMKFYPLTPVIGKWVPASLVALIVGTVLEQLLFRRALGVSTRTVEETAAMQGTWPVFHWPASPSDRQTVQVIFSYGITLAAIGSVESVLTLQACNEITDTVPEMRHSNQELLAQGLANLLSSLFSAMGGDAMIGQSTINIMNGARHRVSSTASGIFMLLFVVILSPLINLLPVATLTGVLFMVVLSTFQWKTFVILRYGRISDSLVILIVTLVAVFVNLAVAIAAGIVFSALVHAWDAGNHIDADIAVKRMAVNGVECDVKYVRVRGSIFFGSARRFVNLFRVGSDPDTVVINLSDALVLDHSAVAAVQGVTHRFAQVGKRVLLTGLSAKSHGRLHRTHGDRDMLATQITHHSQVLDLERGGVTVVKSDTAGVCSKRAATAAGAGGVGVVPKAEDCVELRDYPETAPRTLGSLPMLQNPVELTVSEEIDQLAKSQHAIVQEEGTSTGGCWRATAAGGVATVDSIEISIDDDDRHHHQDHSKLS